MEQPSLELMCEMPKFGLQIEFFVRGLGYEVKQDGSLLVLIDARMGSVLTYLEQYGITRPTLILSDNACLAYQQCVLAFEPHGYLFNADGSKEVTSALVAIQAGQKISNLTKPRIGFTHRDLTIARQLACGKTDAEIADILGLKESSVGKYVTDVLQKARLMTQNCYLANRTQFALWFWGQDHVLDNR